MAEIPIATVGTLVALAAWLGGCDSARDDKPAIQFIPIDNAYEFFWPQRPWLAQNDMFISSERYGLWRIDLEASNAVLNYVGHADTSRTDLICQTTPCIGVSGYAIVSDNEVLSRSGLDGGLWYRHRDSIDWVDKSESIHPRPYPSAFEPLPDDRLLAYSPSFISADGGRTWTDLRLGSFRDVGRDGSDPNEIWLAGGSEHEALLYRSTDAGSSWTKEGLPLDFNPVTTSIFSVAVVDDEGVPTTFISDTSVDACHIWQRVGAGEWTEATFERPTSICFIHSFEGRANYLLVTTADGQLASSNDSGISWDQIDLPFEPQEIMVEVEWDPTRKRFYVLTTRGVYVVRRLLG